jgi:hypothetical protein
MMKNINDLFNERIKWNPILNGIGYHTEQYPIEDCKLVMGDFPDEPLWKLLFFGDSIEFDDKPELWEINYENFK